jgi:hypothetical protein
MIRLIIQYLCHLLVHLVDEGVSLRKFQRDGGPVAPEADRREDLDPGHEDGAYQVLEERVTRDEFVCPLLDDGDVPKWDLFHFALETDEHVRPFFDTLLVQRAEDAGQLRREQFLQTGCVLFLCI